MVEKWSLEDLMSAKGIPDLINPEITNSRDITDFNISSCHSQFTRGDAFSALSNFVGSIAPRELRGWGTRRDEELFVKLEIST